MGGGGVRYYSKGGYTGGSAEGVVNSKSPGSRGAQMKGVRLAWEASGDKLDAARLRPALGIVRLLLEVNKGRVQHPPSY